jgi:diguanylate cyclase (GGDEF)-like protein
MGDFHKSLEYQLDSVKILEEAGDKFGHAAALQGVGNVYEKLEDYESALANYHDSLTIRQVAGDREGEAAIRINLGTCHQMRAENASGLDHLQRALAIAVEISSRTLSYQAHEALSNVYDAIGDYAHALEHYRAFHRLKEEVFNVETDKKITGLVTRFEVERAERESEIYKLRNVELARANQSLQDADQQKSDLVEQLKRQTEELDRQSKEDSLTGLFNRRYLDPQLAHEFERARRFKRDLTVVMADLDQFKEVNDRFSHQAGDEVLRAVARIIKANCRAIDLVARYGGEEFALVLIETSLEKGALLCQKLRAAVENHAWDAIAPMLEVTISMGLAGDMSLGSPQKLLEAADMKLYEAKQGGRNQIRF